MYFRVPSETVCVIINLPGGRECYFLIIGGGVIIQGLPLGVTLLIMYHAP